MEQGIDIVLEDEELEVETQVDFLKGDKGDKGDKGEKGDKGDKGDTGEKGDTGYSPIKGVDYYTEEEQQQLIQAVTDAVNANVLPQEEQRQTNENERINNESARLDAETARQTAESIRNSNEEERQNNENTRISNEQNREQAETQRTYTFTQMQENTQKAVDDIKKSQEEYDANALQKTVEFNSNVDNQTEAFDEHVKNKTTEFDEHTEELTNRIIDIEEKDINQDKLIENLQNQIIELETENENLKNQIPVGQAEGENITLNDSAEMDFKELRIGGNSWQETRSGKNILPNTNTTKTMNGVTFTINADGSITVNGTNEGEKIAYQVRSNISLKPNTKYTFSGCSNGSNSTYLMQIALNTNGSKNYHSTSINPVTFEVVGETTAEVYIVIFKNVTVNNVTFYPQLEEGSTATDYEQFGQMPSPEFRSEIRNVGDNVNLYDKDNPNILNTPIDGNGLGVNAGDTYKTVYIECEPNETYTISKKYDETKNRFTVAYTEEEPTYSMQVLGHTFATTLSEVTIKTGANAKYLLAYVWLNGGTTTYQEMLDSIKIEKGSKATPYSPYNCGNFNETIENLVNYLDWDKFIDSSNWGNSLSNGYKNFVITGLKSRTTYTLCREDNIGLNKNVYACFNNTNNNMNRFISHAIETDNRQYISATSTSEGVLYITTSSIEWLFKILKNCWIVEGDKYIEPESQQFAFPLSEGQRMYKDSYLADDGVHHTRTQKVFDGTEKWNKSGNTTDTSFVAWLDLFNIKYGQSEGLLNIGPVDYVNYIVNYKSGAFYNVGGTSAFLKIENTDIPNWDDSLTDAEKLELFKSYLAEQYANGTPIIFEYILAEEIIEPYTEEQQKVYNEIKKAHSYKNVTHIFSTDEIKPIVKATYRKDLETMFNNINNAILGGN